LIPGLKGWGAFIGGWDEWPGQERVTFPVVRQGTARRVKLAPVVMDASHYRGVPAPGATPTP